MSTSWLDLFGTVGDVCGIGMNAHRTFGMQWEPSVSHPVAS